MSKPLYYVHTKNGLDYLEFPECPGSCALIEGFGKNTAGAVYRVIHPRNQVSRDLLKNILAKHGIDSIRIVPIIEDKAIIWVDEKTI